MTDDEVVHQLTRIADALNGTGMQVTRERALDAWPLRMYEEEYLAALEKLGVEVV